MKYFLGFLISLLISLLTLSGDIQKVIYFADPLNEMAFAVMTMTLSIICLIALFSPDEDAKQKRAIRRSKMSRIANILLDKSEAFDDNPNYRMEIVNKIWKEKN
jgi:hypothetical protein